MLSRWLSASNTANIVWWQYRPGCDVEYVCKHQSLFCLNKFLFQRLSWCSSHCRCAGIFGKKIEASPSFGLLLRARVRYNAFIRHSVETFLEESLGGGEVAAWTRLVRRRQSPYRTLLAETIQQLRTLDFLPRRTWIENWSACRFNAYGKTNVELEFSPNFFFLPSEVHFLAES